MCVCVDGGGGGWMFFLGNIKILYINLYFSGGIIGLIWFLIFLLNVLKKLYNNGSLVNVTEWPWEELKLPVINYNTKLDFHSKFHPSVL